MHVVAGLALMAVRLASGQAPDKAITLEVTEDAGNYVLTVPVSRLVMTIPADGLSRGGKPAEGSTANPRYFLFENHTLHFFVSGWFESAQRYTGFKNTWEDEVAAWKTKNLPAPQDISFESVGQWTAVLYDVSNGNVSGSHIRAHWVQAGTWIDLHVSLTSDSPEADRRTRLRNFLNTIQVSEKKS